MTHALMNTYGSRPLTFVRGEGSWLFDATGQAYLDAISGIAVCNLGHAHPGVANAIARQASTLMHTSNLYNIPLQQELGEKLCRVSGMEKAFFCNSGAEANEAAIKLARLYGHKKSINTPAIIVMEHAFHGRTLATLSATGNRKVQAGFEPLVQGFVRAPYDDVDAIRTIAENNQSVVAILVEPVQGEGGVHVPAPEYLNILREICNRQKWLLMLDEVQTGNGRTGHYFAYQHNGILPDVVTTAKGLGNGFPIGACMARGEAAELFQPGNHGSTFGGNPLGCAAALAVLECIENEKLCAQAAARGKQLLNQFSTALEGCDQVIAIRGKGMMIGIELSKDCPDLVKQAAEKNLLVNVTAGRVVRLLPPLNLSNADAEVLVSTLSGIIRQQA